MGHDPSYESSHISLLYVSAEYYYFDTVINWRGLKVESGLTGVSSCGWFITSWGNWGGRGGPTPMGAEDAADGRHPTEA